MKKIFFLFLFLIFSVPFLKAQQINPCNVFGKVYVTKDRHKANFLVYKAEEGEEDIQIFLENNRLFADKSGRWFEVKKRDFADFVICYVDNKHVAHFSVFFTDIPDFAGCDD